MMSCIRDKLLYYLNLAGLANNFTCVRVFDLVSVLIELLHVLMRDDVNAANNLVTQTHSQNTKPNHLLG